MVADNIRHILDGVEAACLRLGRSPDSVRLIAVGKTFSPETIREAVDAGIADIGENYVQEAVGKRSALDDARIRWHFIGHLQTNKVKYIAEWVAMIQSVDNIRCAQEIQKHAARLGRSIDVLVEVNTSAEATKFGVKPDEAVAFVKSLSDLPNVNIKGLMTIGPFTDNADESRASFRTLKRLIDEINAGREEPLTELSMGMTHDYPIALEEGATMIRIGTAIFGSRVKSVITPLSPRS
ncbi:MAG TPA: YggS family pyridoxal phosphate-dependent enzyme [Bacteroidota bacterium]|nr:YggS family pyridoxal phosphate-dependent enzyme [Bacteroidota bacterium]